MTRPTKEGTLTMRTRTRTAVVAAAAVAALALAAVADHPLAERRPLALTHCLLS